MSVSSRRTSDKALDRFAREFNLPHNGGNQQVSHSNIIDKNKISHTRSTSRDSSKNLHLPLISNKNDRSIDAKHKFETMDHVPNRDSKKPSIPKINDKHYQPIQRRSDNDGYELEEADNEEIEQYINNMNDKDVENLRKGIKDYNSVPLHKKNSADVMDKFKQVDQEFTRGRVHTSQLETEGDVDRGHNSVDDKGNDFYYRPSFNNSNSGMRIKVVKTRPISGKVNDTSGLSNYNTLDGIPRGVKEISNLKSFDSLGIKKDISKKPFANRTNDVNYSDSETKPSEFRKELPTKKKKDSNSFISHISPSKGSFFSHQSPSNKKLEPISARGADGLLKRIELLDEGKKNFLENILDQIEKGRADKEVLLGLEFLRLKKRNAKRVEKRKIIDAHKNQEGSVEPNKSINADLDPSDRQIKLEEQKFLRENNKTNSTNIPSTSSQSTAAAHLKKIHSILDNVDPQIAGEYKFDDEERQQLEKHLERSFLRETKKDNNESHDFSIDISHQKERESAPINMYSTHQTNDALLNDSAVIGGKPKSTIPNDIEHLQTFEDNHDDDSISPKKKTVSAANTSRNTDRPYEKQILIRIISTWGDVNQAGLTKLQLFDEDGNMLLLGAYDFFIKHAGSHSAQTIERLIEGTPYTVDPNEMWTCQMPAPPTTPELYINAKRHKIGALRIWNYNKSLIDSVKGIKEVEIVSDDKLVWSGILNRAPGNDYDEYVTEIMLKDDIYLPDLQTPVRSSKTDLQTIEPESAPVSYRNNEKFVPQAFHDRPISVPMWGSHLSVHKFVSAEEVTTPTSFMSHNTSHERSLPLKSTLSKPKEEHSKTIDAKVSGDDLHIEDLRVKKDELVKTKSAAKIKHPKVRDPIPMKKGEPTHSLASPFKHATKESTPTEISSKKKDPNNSISSLEYFNITNFGRLKPARRESLQEVLSLKQDVEERIHNIEKLLDFKSTPLTEAELLSHLSKKTVSKQLNVIEESQEIVEAPTSFRQALAEIEKIEVTQPSTSSTNSTNPPKPGTSKNSTPFYENKNVKIPELPSGRKLKFIIYSTWGDTYYLGLSGIELFDDKGHPILIKNVKEQVIADPADINSLPGYGQDPRTIDKLFDGTYLTCDDLHVWLAPFAKGKEHYIEIDLKTTKTLSMIRIWNYNKSRIHSYRGVKDISILLDGNVIFCGEIAKAPGSLKGAENSSEYIMFTSKEEILIKIEKDDWLNKIPKQDLKELDISTNNERPLTGTRKFEDGELGDKSFKEEDRPLTTAKLAENFIKIDPENLLGALESNSPENNKTKRSQISPAKAEYKFKTIEKIKPQASSIKCKKILINIIDSWGDPFYVGLTGIEILDQDEKPIELQEDNLTAKPRDMNSIPGYSGDYRTLDKLINRVNQTCDDQNMWMIPFTKGQPHLLTFSFNEEKTISGIRFWNYNKNYDHSCRGVRLVTISADNILVTPSTGVLIKKASGNDYHDFGHYLRLPFQDAWNQNTTKMYTELKPKPMNGFLIQDFDTPELPTGFTFKIVIHESWGDLDYVGLNGIEFYDQTGSPILQTKKIDFTISAEPGSVNVLKGSEGDVRTIDKLVNGDNDTMDDRNMWLAPLLSERRDALLYKTKNNEIIISFDKPILLSCAKFWNYSKTITRGAKEIELYCDDLLIYRGAVKKSASPEDIKKGIDNFSTILFTKNGKLIEKIKPNIYTENGEPQKVTYINEKKVMNKTSKGSSNQTMTLERPSTSVRGKE